MILVLLGTQNNSFKRLLEAIQHNIDKKVITDEVIVQAGFTKFESKDMKIFNLKRTKPILCFLGIPSQCINRAV